MIHFLNHCKGCFRAAPCFIIIMSIIAYLVFQIKFALYFTVYILVVDILSHWLKIIFKFMYDKLQKKSLPLLGIGIRPKGARHTSCFINDNDLQGIPTSFGMPSGHSIISISTVVMLSWHIQQSYPANYRRSLSITVLHFIGIMIAFSRYPLGCHTIQQIIVGCLFGIIIGRIGIYLFEKFEIMKKLN